MAGLRDIAAQAGLDEAQGNLPSLELDLGADGGTFSGYVTEGEGADAFTDFYRLTGLNPDEWVLDQGSLRVSMWQQSKRTDDGHRDLVWLRAYRGNLRRLSSPEVTATDVQAMLATARRHPRVRHKRASERTRLVLASDVQVGKVDRHGGTPEMLERVAGLLELLGDRMASDPCERAILPDPGDLIEGFQNTGSQAHTNDLSHPEMLRVARGVLTDMVSAVASQHAHTRVATCPSNHAAWRRGRDYLGKPGDDYGLDVHRAVRDVLARDERLSIDWVLPETPWDHITYIEERGHRIALTHGDKARAGQFGKWWQGQAASSSQAHGANIVISGHYHTFIAQALGITFDNRERLHLQAPALDGGSAWWQAISGEESKPGLVTLILDEDGWHDIELITL